jgi:hypothetical protein
MKEATQQNSIQQNSTERTQLDKDKQNLSAVCWDFHKGLDLKVLISDLHCGNGSDGDNNDN